jgi:hypothetical protein
MKNLSPFATIALDDLTGVIGGDNTCAGWCPGVTQKDESVNTHIEENRGVQVNPSVDISVLPKNEKT